MKYRKKPVIIEAIQWNENNLKEVMEFIGSEFKYEKDTSYYTNKFNYGPALGLRLCTLEGEMKVSKGDYIIKGIKGEFYPCKPDIFEETYEGVEETSVSIISDFNREDNTQIKYEIIRENLEGLKNEN